MQPVEAAGILKERAEALRRVAQILEQEAQRLEQLAADTVADIVTAPAEQQTQIREEDRPTTRLEGSIPEAHPQEEHRLEVEVEHIEEVQQVQTERPTRQARRTAKEVRTAQKYGIDPDSWMGRRLGLNKRR